MQDVADLAGTSAKTVSRVFNDDPHVTDALREKVQSAMKQLNYVPNMMARTFREGRAPVIGIAVPDIADPFFAALIKEIETAAREQNMSIVVTSLGDDPALEQGIVEMTVRRQISALVIAPIAHDQSYLSRWQANLPIVFVDRAPNKVAADSFVEDDLGGAREATEHLLGHGHQRVAFIGDSTDIPTTRLRLEGYKAALQSAGLAIDEDLIALVGARDPDIAARACVDLLKMDNPPTAIFSSNARFSIGVFPALQAAKRTDVALVSFGDFPMANVLRPAVSVIDQNPQNLGRVAAERLFARLNHPTRKLRRKNVLPVTLVQRESCGCSGRISAGQEPVRVSA